MALIEKTLPELESTERLSHPVWYRGRPVVAGGLPLVFTIGGGPTFFGLNFDEFFDPATAKIRASALPTIASAFLDLTDTPSAYTGEGGKAVLVNVAEDALEFGTIAVHAEAHVLATTGPHTGTLPWGDLSKTGSSLADLVTRAHANLSDAPANAHHTSFVQADADLLYEALGDIAIHAAIAGVHHASFVQTDADLLYEALGDIAIHAALSNVHHTETHVLNTSGPHTGPLQWSDVAADIVNANVNAAAAILESKLSLNFATHAEAHVLAVTGPHTGTLPWGDLSKTGSSLADLVTRTHASLSDAPADAHHVAFVQADADLLYEALGDIAIHAVIAGAHHNAVTIGADAAHSLAAQVLSAVLAASGQIGHMSGAMFDKLAGIASGADVTADNPPQAHDIITKHTESGLTAGQKLTATGATTFAFRDDDGGISFIINGGGSVITAGKKGWVEMPYNAEIEGWTVLADASGTIKVDVNKSSYAGYPVTASIAGSEIPALSAAQKNQDLTLTTWTTALSKGDILEFEVAASPAPATVEIVTVALRWRKT